MTQIADMIARATAPWRAALHRRTRSAVGFLDLRMELLIANWIAVMLLAGAVKVAAAPVGARSPAGWAMMFLPFLLVTLAPVAGYRVAAGSFPRGLLSAQPFFRLARLGQWRQLDVAEAHRNPAFGPLGFMTSLLIGLLLNVPVRTAEYLVTIPAIAPGAPQWAHVLVHAMTLDLIVMNFFYMVCFVMALRSVPMFPRMLAFAWLMDLTLQFAIAGQVSSAPGLPPAVGDALASLLHGNIQKVLISVVVWLPYLLVSERVNVTFRRRTRISIAS
ncbi:DUF2569 domain-containing protein [Novosphingobium album (ex Hu et al. 2023)]|uniref:DUF2569 domain-containing protein n=1 Tax=Novosphingobium album (ex Hu et al. 2023) TaxID=2930093 RepID=A0ABT0B114_9SPHN|nr:DUF2569 domain-containing protein [Novosphingobium album (ex Hu et al. 2023)]MCJ2178715.1 DUF2569 domain-containing protein [Novosphingobium album (ex Hu et al. 2023)]